MPLSINIRNYAVLDFFAILLPSFAILGLTFLFITHVTMNKKHCEISRVEIWEG